MWPVVAAVAGSAISGMMNKNKGDSKQSSSGTQQQTIQPWAPAVPYLTGQGLLPQYLTQPIPQYNPEWLKWAELSGQGKTTASAPPMFLFDNANQGYGGVLPPEAAMGHGQSGPGYNYDQMKAMYNMTQLGSNEAQPLPNFQQFMESRGYAPNYSPRVKALT